MAKYRQVRKRTYTLTKARAQVIATAIVNNPDKALKHWALEFGCSYATIYKVLREYINVSKVLTLRYPNTTEPIEKPKN